MCSRPVQHLTSLMDCTPSSFSKITTIATAGPFLGVISHRSLRLLKYLRVPNNAITTFDLTKREHFRHILLLSHLQLCFSKHGNFGCKKSQNCTQIFFMHSFPNGFLHRTIEANDTIFADMILHLNYSSLPILNLSESFI